jgi:hypothetical protein
MNVIRPVCFPHGCVVQELKEVCDQQGLPRPTYGSRHELASQLAEIRARLMLEEELAQAEQDPQVGEDTLDLLSCHSYLQLSILVPLS